jgi:hypothetical protein
VLIAIEIAKSDLFVLEVLTIINVPDVAFDFSLETLTVHATQDNSVGLVFKQAKTSNPRLGADLILTCDLEARQVVVAHFLIGISQAHALELHSITVDARERLIVIPVDPRAQAEGGTSRAMRQRLERYWAHPHQDPAPLDQREMVLEGWPPDLPEVPRWYYTGCTDAAFTQKGKEFVLQATQVGKQLAGKPDSSERLSLADNEIDLRTEVEHDIETLNQKG